MIEVLVEVMPMIITYKAEAPWPPNQGRSPTGNAPSGGGRNPPRGGGGGGPPYRGPPGQDCQDGPMGSTGPQGLSGIEDPLNLKVYKDSWSPWTCSFQGLCQTMFQVLNVQQHSNFNIQKQLQHVHDTQSAQIETLRKLTHAKKEVLIRCLWPLNSLIGKTPLSLTNG